jgi:hypothetical protein
MPWLRSMGQRYWDGPCQCNSGKEGRELEDARGIYCGIVCDDCEPRVRAKYNPEIFNNLAYDIGEQIEDDY